MLVNAAATKSSPTLLVNRLILPSSCLRILDVKQASLFYSSGFEKLETQMPFQKFLFSDPSLSDDKRRIDDECLRPP